MSPSPRPRPRRAAGITVVEVLVALALLAAVLAGVIPAFLTHLSANALSEQRTTAVRLAEERLEALRLVDPQTLPSSGSQDQTLTRGGRSYTVRTVYCASSSLCNAGSRHIRVEVHRNSRRIYAAETVFTQLR